MLKRNRIRPRNEANSKNTTTSTSNPLPIVNVNVTAYPLQGQKQERKDLNKVKQNEDTIASEDLIEAQSPVKSTTSRAVNLVTRRYETPPPRPVKPVSTRIAQTSKPTKTPKLHFAKVNNVRV